MTYAKQTVFVVYSACLFMLLLAACLGGVQPAVPYPPPLGVDQWMDITIQPIAIPSCSGNAFTLAAEACIHHQTGQEVQLSTQFSFVTGMSVCAVPVWCGGATQVFCNFKAARDIGIPLEQYWNPGVCNTNIPQVAFDHAGEFKATTDRPVTDYEDAIQALLVRRHAICCGVWWKNNFEFGNIAVYNVNLLPYMHAVAILDRSANYVDDLGRPYLQIYNPHGQITEISPAAFDSMVSPQAINRGNIVLEIEGITITPPAVGAN